MNAAIAKMLTSGQMSSRNAALAVLTGTVTAMTAQQKRHLWASLCPSAATLPETSPRRKMIKKAIDALLGDACTADDAVDLDLALLTSMARRTLSANPAATPDTDRVCLAIGIIRRYTLLPDPTLGTTLDCEDNDVYGSMRHAHHQMFSWELRMAPDGSRRVPLPWVADVCRVALRILDDLMTQQQN